MVLALVALHAPLVEVIAPGDLTDLVLECVGAAERRALAGDDAIGIASTGSFGAALPHSGQGLVAVAIDIEAIFAGSLDGEGEIGSVDFKEVSIIETAHAQLDSAQR